MRARSGRAAVAVLVGATWWVSDGLVDASAPAPDAAAIAEAFTTWAADQGQPVGAPACDLPTPDEAPFAVCYGIGGTDVVVAVVPLDEQGAPGAVVALPVPLPVPGPDATEVAGTDAATGPATRFGPGSQTVGVDIEPGTYAALVPAGTTCYWERVSDFSGELSDSIANGSSVAGDLAIVGIDPTDAGFLSDGCGTWTLVAP